MAYTTLPGGARIWYPMALSNPPAMISTGSLNATGDKCWIVGRCSKGGDISRVQFLFGNLVTKAGGSALTVSLQDVDLANGPPMRGDGTQDQTVAIANGDAAFTANGWLRTGTLSANRTVTKGELLAVCIEYDGAGRLGADLFRIGSNSAAAGAVVECGVTTTIGGVFAAITGYPNLVLEYNDGSFGTLEGGFPVKAYNSHTYKQDTGTADEYMLALQYPVAFKTDAAFFYTLLTANTSDFSVILLDASGTAIANGTAAIDANASRLVGSAGVAIASFAAEIEILANTQYYLSFRPTQTTNTIVVYSMDVDDAGHLALHPGGMNWNYSTRLDLGSPAAVTTTRRLIAGLRMSSMETGGSGGGGYVIGG